MRIFEVAIVEDSMDDLRLLKDCLEQYAIENDIVFHISHFTYGEAFLSEFCKTFDIVFMDMLLSGMDGLKTSREFRERNSIALLIFVTSIERYAVKSYDVDADDFILKPVNYSIFRMKLKKALQRIELDDTSVSITIRRKESISIIKAKNIYYIEIIKHDIVYHTTNGELNAYGSLNKIEDKLQCIGFARCCSWCLVNLRWIDEVRGDEIFLRNGEMLRISRRKRNEFMQALAKYC